MQVRQLVFRVRRIDYVNEMWLLRDGDGVKGSTNGTWIFAELEMQVFDSMVIKAGQAIMELTLTN